MWPKDLQVVRALETLRGLTVTQVPAVRDHGDPGVFRMVSQYLGGNPWVAIGNPVTEVALHPMQIDKALPEVLWSALAGTGGYLDQAISNAEARNKGQLRLAKAALLLIGHSGMRREEAANARRENLKKIQSHNLYELSVLGKRSKWRTVFLPSEAVQALEAHWRDRGDDREKNGFILSPLMIPPTTQALRKHLVADDNEAKGFSVDGLGRLITRSLKQVADDYKIAMTEIEREILATRGVSAHFWDAVGGPRLATGCTATGTWSCVSADNLYLRPS